MGVEDRFTTIISARRRIDTTRMIGGRFDRLMIIGTDGRYLKKGNGVKFIVIFSRILDVIATFK